MVWNRARQLARLVLPYRVRHALLVIAYRLRSSMRVFRWLGRNVKALVRGQALQMPEKLIRMHHVVWTKVDAWRPLLSMDARDLGLLGLLKKMLAKGVLAFPDRHFRRQLALFEAAMRERASRYEPVPGSVVIGIGTLGPGGAERQAVLTALGLAKRGCAATLHVLCQSLQTSVQRFFLASLEGQGVDVTALDDLPERLSAQAGLSAAELAPLNAELQLADKYAKAIQGLRPEVLHLWLDECNIKGGMAAVALGTPKIVLGLRSLPPYNFPLHRPYMRAAYQWLAKQPGVCFVNNSKAGARAYEKWLGLPEGTISVIHNGFDFEANLSQSSRARARQQFQIPDNARVIGSIFRLGEEKRPQLWLDIASNIHRQLPEAYFLLIGNGPLWHQMRERIARLGLEGVVVMPGHLEDVMAPLAAMDMFLLTSRVEGLPNVLIEAQAIGLPVVTTPAGGAPEALDHGSTGWVVESSDAAHIANQILRLLKDTSWRDNASVAAQSFVRTKFGVDQMLESTTAVYQLSLVGEFDLESQRDRGSA